MGHIMYALKIPNFETQELKGVPAHQTVECSSSMIFKAF